MKKDRSRHLCLWVLALLLPLIAGCSCGKGTRDRTRRFDRNLITSEEIQIANAGNAYDLIKDLRPQWLEGRGRKSIKNVPSTLPVVYVNGLREGTVNSLRTIPTDNIAEIRFLGPGDAMIRFGFDHPSGAILITMLQ